MPMIEVDEEEYLSLKKHMRFLNALIDFGVEAWERFDEVKETFNAIEAEEHADDPSEEHF